MVGIGSTTDSICLNDRGLNFFKNVNFDLRSTDNHHLLKGIQILSSELIDLIFLCICVLW